MTTQTEKSPQVDEADRDRAVRERRLNVVMDAGAGTGKTTILVRRAVEMIAPKDDGPAYPLSRIAALTFTRKAAGELKLRLRERVLSELASSTLTELRRDRLQRALDELDLAFVGTIHSFADRLLRLRPVETSLSPAFDIAEDVEGLVAETASLLVEGAQSGILPTLLAGTPAAYHADEAEKTIRAALASGIPREDVELEYTTKYGLTGLVEAFVMQRDVPPELPEARAFDAARFTRAVAEYQSLIQDVSGPSLGESWLLRTGYLLSLYAKERDPSRLRQALVRRLRSKPGQARKGAEFGGDATAWVAWKAFIDKDARTTKRSLRDEILAPLDEWLAIRLLRLFPVVVALYEKVKARHGVVDQIDLLLKLRDLLAQNPEARGDYQRLFDHVFIDEFQDTDPLQAEIVMFLCEEGTAARNLNEIVPAMGRLSLVGDPKQSIYRFRRADIAMYERVRAMVAAHEHAAIRLSANFRSKPSLIGWFNDRFEKILGEAREGEPLFNAKTGNVAYQPLVAGRRDDEGPAVHVLPLVPSAGSPKVDDYRRTEAQALARYLRYLTEESGLEILDPKSSLRRPVRYGDIAILAASTAKLPLLFPELDAMGIPHSVRGGTLFLNDPLHRQLLLAVRALADRDDGVAMAALLRPPFFAIDFADLAAEAAIAHKEPSENPRVLRVREAKEIVRELRLRRFERAPGATMRDLVEKTALLRMLGTGPNGIQRVERVFELCLALDRIAQTAQLDFDGASEHLRSLAMEPAQLDPPHPVGGHAVQILTMHQSKGLEFPVTVLWDACASWRTNAGGGPYRIDRDGQSWAISLEGLSWESDAGADLSQAEKDHALAERRRLFYVGATRARDLLVLSKAAKGANLVGADLLREPSPPGVIALEPFFEDKGASWSREILPSAPMPLDKTTSLDVEVLSRFREQLALSTRPHLLRAKVTQFADNEAKGGERRRQKRRYGKAFGNVVHEAIGAVLLRSALSAEAAVKRAMQQHGLEGEHEAAAVRDVERAVESLRTAGLVGQGATIALEYPVAGPVQGDSFLLNGSIDLVVFRDGTFDIVDFKTDPAPDGPVADVYPAYVEQVRLYGEILSAGLESARLGRVGLLFTEDGEMRWCG